MKQELENELYNIDPIFFEHAINCKNGIENEITTCMYWGCECGDGWFEPLKKCIKKISIINNIAKQYNFKFVCDQLKEKYSELRIYYSDKLIDESKDISKEKYNILKDMLDEAIKTAESDCWNVCEWCGVEGGYNGENLVTTSGWISRICKKCAKEKAEKETQKYDKNNNIKHIPRITWFHEGYEFLNPYHICGFKYKNEYYHSIIEAFFCNKDEKHKKLYKKITNLNEIKASSMIEIIANEFNIHIENTKNDYDLLKDIVKAKFSYEYNKNIKDELLETDGKILQNMGKHHNNIWGHCVCDKCKNIEKKDLYAKILMEIRNELKEK